MLIGLCGLKGSGKDTLSDFLVDSYGFVKVSFADTLKDVLSLIFGWSREKLKGVDEDSRIWRESVDEYWSSELNIKNFTPRYALTHVGTDLFRNHLCQDIWVKVTKNKIREKLSTLQNVVVTDCRFMNEVDLIRELGGVLIHIYRNNPDWFYYYKNNMISDSDLEKLNVHRSEYEWIKTIPDFILINSYSKEDFFQQFRLVCQRNNLNFNRANQNELNEDENN